jgi:hypothetical protein
MRVWFIFEIQNSLKANEDTLGDANNTHKQLAATW